VDGWAGKLSRFWECFCLAAFSFSGNEVVAILAAETANQRKVLPKAVRRIFSRITFYYVFAVLALGLTVDCNDPLLVRKEFGDAIRNYPGGFIIMAERAGIRGLPDLINAIQILAAFSVATANLYISVRDPRFYTFDLIRASHFRLWRMRGWRLLSLNQSRSTLPDFTGQSS
jgi:yeast amino acid transporter